MGTSSSTMKEQDLVEFRKLNPGTETDIDLELPAPPEIRTLTDKKGFVIFGILMLIFLPCFIYTLTKADLNRLTYDYDSCGNLCGVANAKVEGISCSGKNYTNKPYKEVNIVTGEVKCSDECPPGYVQDDLSCYGGSEFEGNYTVESMNLWKYTMDSWWKLVSVVVITTITCTFTLLLLRYIPGVIVWGVSFISLALAIALTVFSWYGYSQTEETEGDKKQGLLAIALVLTIFTTIICCIFLVVFKKIKLIIQLYKETAKAMFAMPLMLLLPIITVLFQFIMLVLFCITTTWIISAAHLTKIETSGYYTYSRNWAMDFAMGFNVIVFIWALQFFSGCQYMVLAGSVAQWFFKKNKVSNPIFISFTNTVRFHLGTVAYGAFIITLISVIKALLKSLFCNSKTRWIFDWCCERIETFLKFLSKNAYIETAIHGQSFFKSGQRAVKLLVTNIGSVVAINSVGDFVLGMVEFLLLVITTAIAYALFSNNSYWWFPTIICFFINIIIIGVVFGVFESTVDTLFICFCEDMSLNDGESKPYCMSLGLMQFVDNSKKIYDKKK